MISSSEIESKANEYFKGTDLFLVDVSVSSTNNIHVAFDKMEGAISIEDCIALNRFIEQNFDRDHEDYQLNVSSPGLNEPFKNLNQYKKHIGQQVKIKTNDQKEIKGELRKVDDENIQIFSRNKQKVDGKRKWVEELKEIDFNNIKETKVVISFK